MSKSPSAEEDVPLLLPTFLDFVGDVFFGSAFESVGRAVLGEDDFKTFSTKACSLFSSLSVPPLRRMEVPVDGVTLGGALRVMGE